MRVQSSLESKVRRLRNSENFSCRWSTAIGRAFLKRINNKLEMSVLHGISTILSPETLLTRHYNNEIIFLFLTKKLIKL
jgi:hypothetical protein